MGTRLTRISRARGTAFLLLPVTLVHCQHQFIDPTLKIVDLHHYLAMLRRWLNGLDKYEVDLCYYSEYILGNEFSYDLADFMFSNAVLCFSVGHLFKKVAKSSSTL